MLQELTSDCVRQIASLAKSARGARDTELGNVAEEDFGEPPAARGEHNPTAVLGFDPLAVEHPTLKSLRDAIDALTPVARIELFTLLRIGQGDLAIDDWDRGLVEAEVLGDPAVTGALMEDPDLHDHLAKALYELESD